SSGNAHVVNCDSPGQPPAVASDQAADETGGLEYANVQLGWRYDGGADEARIAPGSRTVGKMVVKDGRRIVVFDEQNAFAAAKTVTNLVPHAATKRSLWQSVWDEGYAVENDHGIGSRRKKPGKNPADDNEGAPALLNTVRL